MKLTIHISDNAVSDVEEYCRIELFDNFQDRIQRLVDKFVADAIEQMEQRRRVTGVRDGRI